jgi:hypothetical protein
MERDDDGDGLRWRDVKAAKNRAKTTGERYYDWLRHEWRSKPGVVRNRFRNVHERLIDFLMSDAVQKGCSDIKLYGNLLARAVVTLDPELMQRYGRHVARRSGERIADGEGQRCGAND